MSFLVWCIPLVMGWRIMSGRASAVNQKNQRRNRVKSPFVFALAPCIPKSFPGRNWIKNEDAFDTVGLLHFFGLLKTTYIRFCRAYGAKIPIDPTRVLPKHYEGDGGFEGEGEHVGEDGLSKGVLTS